jgi:hypothetical protein
LFQRRVSSSAKLVACRKILEVDGYRTVFCGTVGLATSVALRKRVSLIIVSRSFRDVERGAFIDCLNSTIEREKSARAKAEKVIDRITQKPDSLGK